MRPKSITELQVERIRSTVTDRGLRQARYEYVNRIGTLISLLSIIAAGSLVIVGDATLSDGDLQDVAIGMSAVIATVVGFFIVFAQIVLTNTRDVEEGDVTAV